MKKIYLLFILAISSIVSNAQDTIKTQDMPSAGDIFILSNGASFPGIDVVTTGANQNWDFTQLTRNSQRIDSMLNPIQTDTLLSFFFVNIFLNSNRANLAARGNNFALGLVGFNDVYNYYYNSSTDFHQAGFGAVVNNVPLPIAYTPHDVIYKFPLKFNDEDSVSFSYDVDLTSTVGLFYSVQKKRHNLVDGWGELKTPFGTFQTIRVKSIINETDSVYIAALSQGIKTPLPATIEYKWLARGFGEPVLQINTSANNTISQILYQDSLHTIGISEIPVFVNDPIVFPNPASNFVAIRYNLNQKSDVNYNLYSLDGKLIFSLKDEQKFAGENTRIINLSNYNLAMGNYLLKIKAGNEEISRIVSVGE